MRCTDLERSSAQLEQKKMAAEMEERQIVEKLWDSYELSRTEAEKVRQPVESLAKAGRQVSELRRSMSALGTPNLGAIEEYKRVSERYTFLSEQRDDVQKSKDEILKIIADITAQMEEIFVREIQEIDEAFRQIFVELFGGGKASLSLEDMNDVLNCGIDIRIQPPGKAVSNISLLSGGEKAFVAIALYFAIMRVRPTPFCVMDEIESALDEENVARYAAVYAPHVRKNASSLPLRTAAARWKRPTSSTASPCRKKASAPCWRWIWKKRSKPFAERRKQPWDSL